MGTLADLANNLLMIPYTLEGVFRDGTEAYQIYKVGIDSSIELALSKRTLIVASDRHQRIRKTMQFLAPAEEVNATLIEKLGEDNVTFLRGNAEVHERFASELEKLAAYKDAIKIVIYIGHGFRQHSWFGSRGKNSYMTSGQFLDILGNDGSPLIAFFDNCYSGLFAQNVQKRTNSVAIATNTQRTGKPCPKYLPKLIGSWIDGKSLETAFVEVSDDYHKNSFDHLLGNRLPLILRTIGKRVDNFLHVTKATKQLYANGIDPASIHF